MVEPTINKNFWGCWNHLPFPDYYPEVTSTWLNNPIEQPLTVHLLKKTLQRQLFLTISGQRKYWFKKIPVTAKKILWIYITENIGDAIMRLAPIHLLQGYDVDLFSANAATQLFQPGKLFNKIYTLNKDEEQVKLNKYDLVIIDSIQTKPLKKKVTVAEKIPFVTMHELFHFCRNDYNSIYYSWWRMQYLLSDMKAFEDVEPRLSLDITEEAKATISALNIPDNAVGVVLGGREVYKTYSHWDQVLKGIHRQFPELVFILLGSNNGLAMADKIMAEIDNSKIINCVAKNSLMETAAIVERCSEILCVDGGLLHVANALNKKTTTLFGRHNPENFYRNSDRYKSLATPGDVDNIAPEDVIKLFNN